MSLFKSDDNCSICQERAVKVESIKTEERPDPRSRIGTRHEYTMQVKPTSQKGRFAVGVTTLAVTYTPSVQYVQIEVDGKSVDLDPAQFDDLRKVLHAFAFDPKFNGGVGEQV